jgi:hypothetical protein
MKNQVKRCHMARTPHSAASHREFGAAVTALRAHAEGREPQREYGIDTRLVVRESTAYPPGGMDDLKANGLLAAERGLAGAQVWGLGSSLHKSEPEQQVLRLRMP